jgi:hypothetical protein
MSLLAQSLHGARNEIQRWVDHGWLQCRVVQTSGLKIRIIGADDFASSSSSLAGTLWAGDSATMNFCSSAITFFPKGTQLSCQYAEVTRRGPQVPRDRKRSIQRATRKRTIFVRRTRRAETDRR